MLIVAVAVGVRFASVAVGAVLMHHVRRSRRRMGGLCLSLYAHSIHDTGLEV